MCQGLRDVANLCWKLQAVLQAGAPDHLLDTYGAERRGHVTELTTRIKGIGKIVGERDLARARARDAQLLSACGGVVKPTPRQDVQPALQLGLLADQSHAARGTIFPQPWLTQRKGQPQRMDDVLGCGWRLVFNRSADPAWVQRVRQQAMPGLQIAQLGQDGFEETEGVLAAWFDRQACHVAMVRPDHYVFGVASSPAELSSQLQALAHF
jgi:3-(3-hydroxy-phenyl)propionate hydroxylase